MTEPTLIALFALGCVAYGLFRVVVAFLVWVDEGERGYANRRRNVRRFGRV